MNQIQIMLSCGHSRRFVVGSVPELGDEIYCRFDGNNPVVAIYDQEWHVRCLHVVAPKVLCRFSRWVGQDKREASRKRYWHSKNHPYATIGMEYDTVTKNGLGTAFPGRIILAKRAVPATLTESLDANGWNAEPHF